MRAAQPGWASAAFEMAASTSETSANGTCRTGLPSVGSYTSAKRPEVPGTGFPATKCVNCGNELMV
ncbi:Uncharacterised protein [Mycobacteroides abscessus subsp. abscessus]|nr:Uncharacterised protein [Mycobacteroides abscessus subsp. abscessus]